MWTWHKLKWPRIFFFIIFNRRFVLTVNQKCDTTWLNKPDTIQMFLKITDNTEVNLPQLGILPNPEKSFSDFSHFALCYSRKQNETPRGGTLFKGHWLRFFFFFLDIAWHFKLKWWIIANYWKRWLLWQSKIPPDSYLNLHMVQSTTGLRQMNMSTC